jgi:hypothetical protein
MAIYLNLYHEIQKQKLKRQRDPLKIAIMGLIVIAVGLVGYYFFKVERVHIIEVEAGGVSDDLRKILPKADQAQKDYDTYDRDIKLAAAMIHKMENRFYWAPLLQEVIDTVPQDVQITGLNGTVSSDGGKKIILTISGMAAGSQPRAVAEELRIALQNKLATDYHQPTTVFRSLEDGPEPVVYQGKSSPTVLFVIELTFTRPDIDDADKIAKPIRVPKT